MNIERKSENGAGADDIEDPKRRLILHILFLRRSHGYAVLHGGDGGRRNVRSFGRSFGRGRLYADEGRTAGGAENALRLIEGAAGRTDPFPVRSRAANGAIDFVFVEDIAASRTALVEGGAAFHAKTRVVLIFKFTALTFFHKTSPYFLYAFCDCCIPLSWKRKCANTK